MMQQISNPDERGQVGIGTLIVFIAMVLVAAIAAGVLINTAGFLQSQAEDTGEEATDEVANQLEINEIIGDADNGDIESLDLHIQASAGADLIDLSEAELLYIDGENEINEDPIDNDDIEGGAGEEDTIIGGEEDTAIVDLDLSGNELDSGNDAEIVITTTDGAQAETFITAPDPLQDDTVRL